MKELKILAIVVFFTALVYIGVEPFAHSQMHPHVAPADFAFKDLESLHVKGDKERGMELVQTHCIACHGLKTQGFPDPLPPTEAALAYGVVPPDLSTAGVLYDANYLAAFLKDPLKASELSHKFNEAKPYPMPSYNWMSEQEIADMLAYFSSIAPQELLGKEAFKDACGRCHSMKYDALKAQTPNTQMMAYLGAEAPDVSMMIRSKKEPYLQTFINQPLKMIEGVAMPRVGLKEEAQKSIIAYMEHVGDRKKVERETVGYYLIGFMVIFTLFAYLWKVKIWKEVE